jgi:hypothetical protein
MSLFFAVVMAPTFIGIVRQHPQLTPLFFVNLFFGWTFFGWVIALVWAVNTIYYVNTSALTAQGNSPVERPRVT